MVGSDDVGNSLDGTDELGVSVLGTADVGLALTPVGTWVLGTPVCVCGFLVDGR